MLVGRAKIAVVKQIVSLNTGPNSPSIGEIARRLNELQIPSPGGQKWATSSVGRILRSPRYIGTAYYNRHQTDYTGIGLPKQAGPGRLSSARYKERPQSEWIEVAVPLIVLPQIWDMAQRRLEMNARFSARNAKRTLIITWAVSMWHLSAYLTRTLPKRCSNRCPNGGKNRAVGISKHSCTLRADYCEDAIWQQLADLGDQPQRLKLAWQAHQASLQPTSQARWQKRIAEREYQRQRLLDAYQAGASRGTDKKAKSHSDKPS